MEEKELVEQLKKGDKEAEELFVEKYAPFIFNIIFQITRRKNLTEDVVQDVFLIALKDINKFGAGSALSTWLYRIAANRAKYILFREGRQKVWEKDAVEKRVIDNTPEEYKKDKLKEIIWKGMEFLNENEREIITLIDIEGMKYYEASKLLNIPVGTVRSRVARARERLRNIILKWNFFKEELSNK